MDRRQQAPSLAVLRFLAERRWTTLAGYGFYVAALAAGYYYNLTFVQLGLVDLGTRLVGMSPGDVSVGMAVLALVAVAVAVPTGMVMDRRGWSNDLRMKLRLLFAVVAVQLALTIIAPLVRTPGEFLAWVLACSATLGAGIPVTFGLMVDLVPVRDRGMVAAIVAGLAFAVAAVYPLEWRIESFSVVLAIAMAPAAVVLGVLSFRPTRLVQELGRQHLRFGTGRFCRPAPVRTKSAAFWGPVVLMFGVFFIDSLGFLRLVDTPVYIFTSWQSPEVSTRLFIAATHVVGAAMAGVLYTSLGRRWLFLWVFGLFAFTHLLYTFHAGVGSGGTPPLVMPMFYVLAVSFYTTLNFALWPDLSTPETIGTHTALGVGIAGFLASFLSTALALASRDAGVSLLDHLRYVNALALLLAVGLPVTWYGRRMVRLAREGEGA